MIIEIVGAVLRDEVGRLLTVRKAGTKTFMLPGGKLEPGETPKEALARELEEELGVAARVVSLLGRFEAPAANEPDAVVRSTVYHVQATGQPQAAAEIAELRWIDPSDPQTRIAPLLERWVLPALQVEK